MKRAIVDYKKLTKDILALLVEKYPEGYQDRDVIRFKNAKNETVEALEVRTEDTIYLVKVSTRLATSMERYDEEEDEMRWDEGDVFPDDLYYSFYYYSKQVLILLKPLLEQSDDEWSKKLYELI